MVFLKKAVLVTGAGAGTGYAIAERFAKEGWDVFVTARSAENAANAAKKLSETYGVFAKGYALELCNENHPIEVFADIDKLGYVVETLCLNAADLALAKDPSAGTKFFEVTPEEFHNVLKANLVGNFRIVQQAALRMREQHKGSIVFISSNSAVRPNPHRVHYVTSKGGMNSMSKSLAVDLGQYGIRSNVIMPGTIKTTRWVAMGTKQISNGEMTPIGDISDFEDIANAVWFLGTDESKNVTGAEIMLDGGMSCQIYPQLLNDLKAERIARELENK